MAHPTLGLGTRFLDHGRLSRAVRRRSHLDRDGRPSRNLATYKSGRKAEEREVKGQIRREGREDATRHEAQRLDAAVNFLDATFAVERAFYSDAKARIFETAPEYTKAELDELHSRYIRERLRVKLLFVNLEANLNPFVRRNYDDAEMEDEVDDANIRVAYRAYALLDKLAAALGVDRLDLPNPVEKKPSE